MTNSSTYSAHRGGSNHRSPMPRDRRPPPRESAPGSDSPSQAREIDNTPLPPMQGAFGTLLPEIQRALVKSGYHTPTPVQEMCIPHLLARKDLMGSAQTGTGKTAAFTLPLLQLLVQDPKPLVPRKPRVLILAPTRELAAQIGESIATYGHHLPVRHTVVFGGVGQRPQETAMQRGVDFLVATPGRLLDLMNQGFVKTDAIEFFVLDEADRMLDMGFIHDVKRVIAVLPKARQSLFFSATLAPEVISLANSLLTNPVHISIEPEKPTVERIGQKIMFVDKEKKDDLLVQLLEADSMDKVILFTKMKHAANKVTAKLISAGISAAAIHGNKSQTARTAALEAFRQGKVRVLAATDIAARGVDVDGVTHVINYDLPTEPETYVHRIGRTARAGAEGDAISFCSGNERDQWRDILRLIRKDVVVDREHDFHSNAAESATGADARPLPKQQGQRRNNFSPRNNNSPRSPNNRNDATPFRSSGRGGRGR
jgi:ATP-dependent RNA helicase RhlE